MGKSNFLSVRVSDELSSAIKDAAQRSGNSKSGIVQKALEAFFDTKDAVNQEAALERRLRLIEQSFGERFFWLEHRVDENARQINALKTLSGDPKEITAHAIKQAQKQIPASHTQSVGWGMNCPTSTSVVRS